MSLTNHLLTGATLAKFLPLPVALPLAVLSHFVLDALPHFGYSKAEGRDVLQKHKKAWLSVTGLDVVVAIVTSVWLFAAHHPAWFIVGLAAYLPDFAWFYRFIVEEKFGKKQPTLGNRLTQFHRNIQNYERPWGGAVELFYALGLFAIIH